MKLVTALVVPLLLGTSPAWATTRFALVMGSNQGSPEHSRLWFAESDAVHFASALTEVGEFRSEDVTVLQGPSATTFRQAFASMEGRIDAAEKSGGRALLVVYFSGHATEKGLELGPERITYDELRAYLNASHADARVAVVDACDAGALTQVKGGVPSAAVNFALPIEDHVQGVAYVASTAVGEPAQESVALAGSFFTRSFEIAMRGAGDSDGDGQVTLDEAFRYASTQTVAATAETRAGPQHPTYEMKMSGRGDVVLADLRHAEAILSLPAAEGSRYLVRSEDGVVAELPGTTSPIRLALKAGHYTVDRESSIGTQRAEFDLARGESRELPPTQSLAFADASRKGGTKGFGLFGGAALSSGTMLNENISWGASIGVTHRIGPIIGRVSFDYTQSSVQDRALSYQLVTLGGSVAGLKPLLVGDAFRVAAGLQVGCAQASEYINHGISIGTVDFDAGPLLSVSYPVGILRLGVDLTAAVHALVVDYAPAFRFTAGCMMTAGVEL